MKIFSIVFSIVVIVFGVTFAVLNSAAVEINFVFYAGKVPLSLALVLALGIGALFGVMVSLVMIMRLKRINHKLEKQLDRELRHGSASVTMTPATSQELKN